jgi:hypothetical protein
MCFRRVRSYPMSRSWMAGFGHTIRHSVISRSTGTALACQGKCRDNPVAASFRRLIQSKCIRAARADKDQYEHCPSLRRQLCYMDSYGISPKKLDIFLPIDRGSVQEGNVVSLLRQCSKYRSINTKPVFNRSSCKAGDLQVCSVLLIME